MLVKGSIARVNYKLVQRGKHKGSINVKEKKAIDVVTNSWKGTAVEKHIQSVLLFNLRFLNVVIGRSEKSGNIIDLELYLIILTILKMKSAFL